MIRHLLETVLIEDSLLDHGWASAIKIGDRVLTADDHAACWFEYASELGISEDDFYEWWDRRYDELPDAQEGFVGPDGQYHTREAAVTEWRKQFGKKVWRPDADKRDWGDSQDLYGSIGG